MIFKNLTEIEQIKKLERIIQRLSNGATTCIIENYSQLNKPILIAFSQGALNKIRLFDAHNGSDFIGEITYSRHKDNVFISFFEVKKEYQQKGLGKLLFNLSLAHIDYRGGTKIYGEATPMSEVLGINTYDEDSFDQIQNALYLIYKKLGCEFDFNTFKHSWKPGEKFNKLPLFLQDTIKDFEEKVNGYNV